MLVFQEGCLSVVCGEFNINHLKHTTVTACLLFVEHIISALFARKRFLVLFALVLCKELIVLNFYFSFFLKLCSSTKFIAIIVNVCVFFMQNFRLTILTFRVTFTPLTFCVSRDLKLSLNHNFKRLHSIGDNLIPKV